jgi:type II secretory pathway component PulF
MKALDFISEVTKNKTLKTVIDTIMDSINNGNSFSYAISQQGIFSETFIQVISASEKSGNLEKGLTYLADYMNKRIDTRKKLRRVFSYPAVILTMAFGRCSVPGAVHHTFPVRSLPFHRR